MVNINPVFTPEQRDAALRLAKVNVLLTTRDLNFTQYAPFAPQLLFVEDLTAEISVKNEFLNWLDMSVFGYVGPRGKNDPDRLVTVICELKDNGEMKAIPISERNVLAQLKSIRQIFSNVRGQKMITDLDWSTAFGFVLDLIYPICGGMKMNLSEDRSFEQALKDTRPAYVLASSELVNDMLKSNQLPESVRFIHTDHRDLSADAQEAIKEKNISLLISAGMNETCSIFSANTPGYNGLDIAGKKMTQSGGAIGTVGRPLPGLAVRVTDPQNPERMMAPGQVGQVLLKGAAVVNHYLGQCKSWSRDFYQGWLVTPLNGYIDKRGFLVLV